MKKQISLNHIVFIGCIVIIVLSVASGIVIWVHEKSAVEPAALRRVSVTGVYFTQDDPTQRPLPEGGALELPDIRNTVTVIGHFSQPVAVNEIISLRLDNLSIQIFVNGQRVYSYGDSRSVLPYARSAGSVWKYFPSPGIETSDEVKIMLRNAYPNHVSASYQLFFEKLSVGNPAEQIASDLQGTTFRNLIALFILLLGFLELGYALVLLRSRKNANEYFALSGLSVFSGIWFLVNFEIMAFFVPYPILNNAVQCLSLCLSLCYALVYIGTQLTGINRIWIRASAVLAMLFVVVTVLFQHAGWLDYYEFTPIIYVLMGVLGAEIVLFLCLEYRKRRGRAEKRRLLPLFLLLAGALLDLSLGFLGLIPFLAFEIAFCLFDCWQLHIVWSSINEAARDKEKMLVLQEDHERQQRLLEYQNLLSQSTKGLYDSIYELNITHNCAGGESTKRYFESLGIPGDTPFDQALRHIAKKQIHEKYRKGYLETFAPSMVLEKFSMGTDTLQYDFLFSKDGENYYWMRIDARVFFWNADRSVRMIVYRQNVDDEKHRELVLLNRAQQDQLTGLFNREATEQQAKELLQSVNNRQMICCMIIDIDNFKGINDTFGHMAGDYALIQFAKILRAGFFSTDIIGRLGGDEFIIFTKTPDQQSMISKAAKFVQMLSSSRIRFEDTLITMSASIGIAFSNGAEATFETLYKESDTALYRSKHEGKNRSTIYVPSES